MVNWKAYYYEGTLPLREYASEEYSWSELPKNGVVFVDVFFGNTKHRLQGMDNYWVRGDTFGVFNDAENAHIYTGHQSMIYDVVDGNEVCLGEGIPQDVYWISGIMLDDNVAREVGLL